MEGQVCPHLFEQRYKKRKGVTPGGGVSNQSWLRRAYCGMQLDPAHRLFHTHRWLSDPKECSDCWRAVRSTTCSSASQSAPTPNTTSPSADQGQPRACIDHGASLQCVSLAKLTIMTGPQRQTAVAPPQCRARSSSGPQSTSAPHTETVPLGC
jgi:hypothetical protein